MPPMNGTIRVLSPTGPTRRRAFAAAGLAAVVAVAVAACGGGSSSSSGSPMKDGFSQAPQSSSGALTVWVDSTRVPAAQAYQKAHPNVKLNIVTYDGDANGSNFLQTKVDLFNRTGSGWPDVVFSTQQNETTWAVTAGFAAPLNEGLIPQSTLSNFATGSLNVCTVNGKVYCLRNDLAQVVLWYNAALMKKWGYQVPTTWPQYEALGQKVASAASRLPGRQRRGHLHPRDLHVGQPVPGQRHHRPALGDGQRDQPGLHAHGFPAGHADQGRLDVEAERVQHGLRQERAGQGADAARARPGSAARSSTARRA